MFLLAATLIGWIGGDCVYRKVVVVVVSLIITLSTAKLHQFCRLKLYEIKYNISLNDVHTWQQ